MDTEKNWRVLVVDDNPTIHEDFKKVLCPRSIQDHELTETEALLFGEVENKSNYPHFELHSAFQGQEALELIQRSTTNNQPYAMAFMDVRMPPGWDGVETTKRIWSDYPDLQVVICTAYADYSWSDFEQKLGHPDQLVILKKPFEPIEVQQLAYALTAKWLLLQQARARMTDLEQMVAKRTAELSATNAELQEALANIKTLSGLLPICSYCKKIRDDKGYWNQLEAYIQRNSEAKFSHGCCPNCLREHFPDIASEILKPDARA